jgi:hypothetical protein
MRIFLALVLALPLTAVSQSGRKVKEWLPSEPSNLHAPALTFGAELEKAAPRELLNWAEPYAKKDLRSKPLDPQGTTALVDERFAAASVEARDAATYLLFYLSYREEDFEQRMFAARLREIDRETTEITRQLQVIWKNEQNRSASPTQGISQEQRVAIEEDIQRKESQLRDLADERQLKSGLFEASRKRVNALLKLLAAVHPRMKGVEPNVLKSVGPPT